MYDILLKNIEIDGKPSNILIKDGIIQKIILLSSDNSKSLLNDRRAELGTDNSLSVEKQKALDTDWQGLDKISAKEIMDCKGMVAVSGFVNMHTHAAMSLMRGVGEDIAFHQWLDKVWKIEANLDEDFIYWGTKVACLEMIKTGTTTFNDHYWFPKKGQKAGHEMGLRIVSSYVVIDKNTDKEDQEDRERCLRLYEESKNWPSSSKFSMAFHAPYSVSEDKMIWAAEFSQKRNLPLHIHLSETKKEVEDCKKAHGGLSPVEYLNEIGVLGPNLIAAHTLWLSDKDVQLLGQNKVTCVHNINSNLKISSGYHFLYSELRDAGCRVCIGTDGCASSNNLDMLEAMKTTALLQKGWRFDPSVCPISDLLEMATLNGAKALGINSGEIKEGMNADIMLVDTNNYNFLSPGSFLANFIYSAHSDCIDSLICGGKFIMKNRIVEGEQEILENAWKVIKQIKSI